MNYLAKQAFEKLLIMYVQSESMRLNMVHENDKDFSKAIESTKKFEEKVKKIKQEFEDALKQIE